jgi:hypothetical protein
MAKGWLSDWTSFSKSFFAGFDSHLYPHLPFTDSLTMYSLSVRVINSECAIYFRVLHQLSPHMIRPLSTHLARTSTISPSWCMTSMHSLRSVFSTGLRNNSLCLSDTAFYSAMVGLSTTFKFCLQWKSEIARPLILLFWKCRVRTYSPKIIKRFTIY